MTSSNKGQLPAATNSQLPVPLELATEQHPATLGSLVPEPGSPEGGGYAPALSSPLSLGNLLKAFRQRWLLAVSLGLILCGTFGTAAWYLRPAKYTAYALLRVEESEPQPLLPDQRWQGGQERYFENTQVMLIKSRPIILAALRKGNIADLETIRGQANPAVWLEGVLTAAFLEKTDILRVSLDGTNPTDLAAIVNAVKDAYLEEAVNAQRNKKLELLQNLEQVYLGSEENIRNRRETLRGLAKTAKSSDPKTLSMKEKTILDRHGALQSELTLLQAKLRNAQIQLAIHKTHKDSDDSLAIPQDLIDPIVETDPLVAQRRSEVDSLNKQIRQVSKMLGPGHQSRIRLEEERKALMDELEKFRAAQRAVLSKRFRSKMHRERDTRDQEAVEAIEIWRQQETLLQTKVDDALKEAETLGLTMVELESKRNELEQAEEVVRRLRAEKERLQVELQSSKRRISVLLPAEVPTEKNLKTQIRIVAIAAIAGLLLGVFGICYWEALARRVLSKEDVVNELGCRVIGVLPWVEEEAERRQQAPDPLAMLGASVDDLRALLLCEAEEKQNGRILMVTSAVAREGKTTLASHLAVSIAQAGRKTLLIDCDFRRPRLHHVFDLSCSPGLSDVLRGKVSAIEAIRPGPVADLSILTTGEGAHHISQAQVMHEMRKLLEELRKEYDFILVDSCPVLSISDALLIGKRVDGVLLSIRPGTSQFPLVSEAFERLTSLHIPVLGAVVNGVRSRMSAYGYEYLLESHSNAEPSSEEEGVAQPTES